MVEKAGLDDTPYTLTEHLTELRKRLAWSMLAVVVTTGGALVYAPEILEYSIRPLAEVLNDRARVETLVLEAPTAQASQLSSDLKRLPQVRLRGVMSDLAEARRLMLKDAKSPRAIDLVMVDAAHIGSDGALLSDVLEGVEPAPYVVYLVSQVRDPVVLELLLEGVPVLKSPPREAVLRRIVRRAGGAAGKSTSDDKLVVLSPLEPFFAYIKIALVCGLFMACPIWLYQVWLFIAPGLYSQEKKVVMPAVLLASILFISGGLFAYYLMFPVMFDVLVNQMMPDSLTGTFTVDKYLGLLLRLTVAFGLVFELPLLMALLTAVGLVDAARLRKFRKYAIVVAFVVSAFLTPADPLSQAMMAIPLIVFYELGIILAVILQKRRTDAVTAVAD